MFQVLGSDDGLKSCKTNWGCVESVHYFNVLVIV